MLFADLTGGEWVVIISTIGVPQLLAAYLAYRSGRDRLNRDEREAKATADRETARVDREKVVSAKVDKVEAVTAKTAAKTTEALSDLADVTAATHALVNSAMGVQLKVNADLARWKATSTGDPGDDKAAKEAEDKLAAHVAGQAKADARTDKGS